MPALATPVKPHSNRDTRQNPLFRTFVSVALPSFMSISLHCQLHDHPPACFCLHRQHYPVSAIVINIIELCRDKHHEPRAFPSSRLYAEFIPPHSLSSFWLVLRFGLVPRSEEQPNRACFFARVGVSVVPSSQTTSLTASVSPLYLFFFLGLDSPRQSTCQNFDVDHVEVTLVSNSILRC